MTLGIAGVITATAATAVPSAAQNPFTERRASLPDGTPYVIRVPSNWNGTVIRDLDYAGRADGPVGMFLLSKGYAMAGTQRHHLRVFQYDPAREIANLNSVLDIFQENFRKPNRVIQYGCSGGGHVSLAIAEDYADRVDGVIALGAHTPVWLMNTFLDGWFALKALLAPDLQIVNLPFMNAAPSAHGVEGELPSAWRRVISSAQETREGRARIALAFALGQWPFWGSGAVPLPDLRDVSALQHSMYHTLSDRFASNPGGEARILFESAAQGQQLSWNTDVDYRQLFANSNESYQRAVRQLYQEAGLDLDADLARVNAAPKVTASSYALKFWDNPGRNVNGNPKVPLLRMHEIGDFQVPMALVMGYDALVQQHGKGNLYRTAYVQAPTHCGFNVAESAAAVETMMRRLNTGSWGNTDPASMNALAASLGSSADSRFIAPEQYMQQQYNRSWAPRAAAKASR